ncbi:hypothetical protein MBLNU230_g5970t1 [Neophaeotheca triangularis]
MAADVLTPAILGYIDHGAYPESEDIASAEIPAESLEPLVQALQNAQNEAKNEVRALSRSTASDIDTWISRAKELQSDILRSRDTARDIVSAAEEASKLKSDVQDAGSKAALLEKEVAFNDSLVGTLEHLRSANAMLDGVQEKASAGQVAQALRKLEEANSVVEGLGGLGDSRAYGLLKARSSELKSSIAETANDYWNLLVAVNIKDHCVVIRERNDEAIGGDIQTVLDTLAGLQTLDATLQRFGKDFERAIIRPRIFSDRQGRLGAVNIDHDRIECQASDKSSQQSTELFKDLHNIVDYLATRLPSSVCVPLSQHLIPKLASQLEEEWLDPAMPLDLGQLDAFNQLLADVIALADKVDGHDWHGSAPLREWVQSIPRLWLTKRREAVLGDVRNVVFAGLRDTKVVERVETQMVSKEDALAGGGGGGEGGGGEGAEDEWGAWDDQDEDPVPPTPQTKSVYSDGTTEHSDNDDDEATAWGIDDADDIDKDEDNEEEAWGWDNEDDTQKPGSPTSARKQPPSPLKNISQSAENQPQEREMTLRESYTVTSIPDSILSMIQQIISDAQSLATPAHASSPIAPAAAALYTIPTLALAIYRATAPTAYSNLPVGNMLIYNDALRLASSLRNWQATQPAQSRLRLDADVKALETFAKRAYTSEMEAQRTVVRDMLDGAQGFGSCTVQPYKSESESAVEQTVDRLREVHRQWKDILPPSALLQSLGNLLATVTGKVISEVEDLQDISEADSKQLKKLLDTVSGLRELFITPAQPQQSGGGPVEGGGEGNDMTFIYCPSWLKFQYLGEVLESSLADIKYMWQEGELSLEFEPEEVVDLIEALFAESDYRRKAVGDIRRGR